MATEKKKFTPGESWSVLKELPHEVDVTVELGWRDGREQFTSHFQHENHRFRLVINQGSHKLSDGETWKVRPTNTPNGHVIFCSAVAKVADAPNPFLRVLKYAGSEGDNLFVAPTDDNIFGLRDDGDDTPLGEMSAEEIEREITTALGGKE